jgi:hypothetical protein
MMTFHEAQQRLSLSGLSIRRNGKNYKVTTYHSSVRFYITDDLEDAVITGVKQLRAKPNK